MSCLYILSVQPEAHLSQNVTWAAQGLTSVAQQHTGGRRVQLSHLKINTKYEKVINNKKLIKKTEQMKHVQQKDSCHFWY